MPFSEYLSFAHVLADAAGKVLLAHFRQPLAAERKADDSPVTVADRAAEKAMHDLIRQHYPEHGIFGEEHERVNPQAPLQWVLDPIDGTRAFMAGYPTFTTLIALCENGIPLLGMINQPWLKERWAAVKGQSSTLNGKPCQTNPPGRLQEAIIATTSTPYYFNAEELARFERLRGQCGHTVVGGDGYGYAMLASGRIGVFADTCLKPYDFCALAPVIEGAGGVITDWQGQKLTLSSNGQVLAAASPELHRQALAQL